MERDRDRDRDIEVKREAKTQNKIIESTLKKRNMAKLTNRYGKALANAGEHEYFTVSSYVIEKEPDREIVELQQNNTQLIGNGNRN